MRKSVSLSVAVIMLIFLWTACAVDTDPDNTGLLMGKPSVSVDGPGSLTITWTALNGATAYEVYYGTVNNTASADKYGDDLTDTTVTITGLTPNTLYYIWVKAKSGEWTTGFSPVVSRTTANSSLVVDVEPTGPGAIQVAWEPLEDVDSYEVYYSTTGDFESAEKYSGQISSNAVNITGLDNNTLYYIWVYGVPDSLNVYGTAEVTTNTYAITPAAVPSAPGAVTVTWTEVDLEDARYEVSYSTTNNQSEGTQSGEAIEGVTAEINELSAGTLYYIWVRAVKDDWTGDLGTPAQVTTYTYGIELKNESTVLNESTPLNFGGQDTGYGSVTPKTVSVRNTGTGPTGELSLALSGTNDGDFEFDVESITSIVAGGSGDFTVKPKDGLPKGVYSATVTVTGPSDTGISASFDLSFMVSDVPIGGSIGIAYDPGSFGPNPQLTYADATLNEAGEIVITAAQTFTIAIESEYQKAVYVDGELQTSLEGTTTSWIFSPDDLDLTPGPHRVTVFFHESSGSAFIASAELKFRISE